MKTDWHHGRFEDLVQRVPKDTDNPFVVAIERGQLYVELYCPEAVDHQQPHDRDELLRPRGRRRVRLR